MARDRALGRRHGVDRRDATLIGLNLWGLSSHRDAGRVRLEVVLEHHAGSGPEWHLILATGRHSPFAIEQDALLLNGQPIGSVREVEHDDAHLGYVRGDGVGLTLNTNRRSTCTGCVFCPNTLADAGDPRTSTDADKLKTFLDFLCLREGWSSLAHIQQANLSTGCFGTAERAIEHLALVRRTLDAYGFAGRIGILSSVIRRGDDFRRMHDEVGNAALFLTLECLNRRALILKDSKADLTPDGALRLLATARSEGIDTGVTLIVGLDDPAAMGDWLASAASDLTDFPNLQVFQSHSPIMDDAPASGRRHIAFHAGGPLPLGADPIYGGTGLVAELSAPLVSPLRSHRASMSLPNVRTARVVDLVEGLGLSVEPLVFPSHAATVQFSREQDHVSAMGFRLDDSTALLTGRQLSELRLDADETITIVVESVGSAAFLGTRLRQRLATLLELPEAALATWDDRAVRHSLLFVLEGATEALRNERLMALEAALGSRNTL